MKRIFACLSIMLLALFVFACDKKATNEVEGIVITSQGDVRSIKVGESLQLKAVVAPKGADQSVEWQSSDDEIATVNEEGLVTAIKVGKVNIIATSKVNEEISQSFALIIEKADVVIVEPESIKINESSDTITCKAGEKITLSAIVLPEEASQAITWSSDNQEVATVSRGEVTTLKEGTVVITASPKGYIDIKDSVTITVEKADAPGYSNEWDKMDFSSHKDFLESEGETPLKVKGIVTHVSQVKEGCVNYFIQNGTEGYYVYNQNISIFPVEAGKVYEVGGFKKYYRGLNEIVDVEYFKEISESITYVENDINSKDATSLTEMEPFHCSVVKGEATLDTVEVNESKAYSFYAIVNGKSVTFRADPGYSGDAEFAEINKVLKGGVKGMKFEFKGFMTAFGYGAATPQIQIVKASDIAFSKLSDADLLVAAAESLSITSSLAINIDSIELPKVLEGFDGVNVSWTSDNSAINVETGAVTHSSENVSVILTAKLVKGSEELVKEFEVIIFALDNKEYEVVATFDCEDALAPNQWGNSESKSGYAEGIVVLGNPKATWLLRNALIAAATNDLYDGTLGIRAKAGKSAAETGRIEIQQDGEYNVVEFATGIYGNDKAGIQIKVEYSFDSGKTWESSNEVITVETKTLETYRISLPEGVKRVAIVIVENSGNRANIDNIKLMK